MLHGLCFGEEAGARNLVFFRVIKVVAAGDERYLVCAAVAAGGVPDVMGSSSVLNLWLQIALEWLCPGCLVPRLHA